MHGFSSRSTLIVNAEVDSMGGIVDGGVDIDTNPSPRQAAIEKAQAELRVEYDVREERRRELEFLEKGGDPLDFKFGRATSVSVQSTSNTDQHQEINLTSEAKGSFALTASPHRDSVESNGRLGVTTAFEQNSADNFDGENEILQNDRKLMHSGRSSITPLEHSQRDGCRDVKDSEDSPIFHPKKGQAYRRRNRFRTNRDGPRSSSADMTSCGGHASSMPAQHVALSKSVALENQFEIESDGTHVIHSSLSRVADVAQGKLSLSKSEEKLDEVHHLSLKVDEVPVALKIVEADTTVGRNSLDTVDAGCPPSGAGTTENNASSPELHETGVINDDKCTPTDALVKNAPVMMKGLDSESSCTQTNDRVDGNENIDSDLCTNLKNVDSNGAPKGPTLSVGENSVSKDDKLPSEELVTGVMKTTCNEDKTSVSLQGNGFNEDCAEVVRDKSSLQDKVNGISNVEAQEEHNATMLKSESELERCDSCISKVERSCPMTSLMDPASSEVDKSCVSGSSPVLDSQPSTGNQPKTLDKAQEDRILEEARMIEAKHKRIAELSVSVLAREHRHRCHWDLVLEEMAWLSNDFAQERVWKMTAAAQICRRVALASRKRLEEQSKFSKQRGVAHTLAKAVMEFWHSASLFVENVDSPLTEKCKHEVSPGVHEMNKASQDVLQSTRRKQDHAVYGYAVRFLQFNRSPKPVLDGEVPGFANVPFDVDLPDVSWEDRFTEENLFYAVPPGAMEMYRTSIMSHLADCERIGKNNHEEADISGHDAAECGYEDNGYEEDEGENLYYLPGGIDTGKPSKKKRKNRKSYEARSYEYGGDVGYGHCAETRNGTPQLNVTLKRPTSSLHVDPIPTKRMRTASRQRVVGPFGAAPAGFAPVLSKADASSGDTNSFQDDLSTLHGVSVVPRGSEVDSAMNFEKQTTFDSAEMPAKSKKKKKIKHSSVSYDQRWQLDSSMQNEQKDLVRKRVDHQLESNGNGGLYGQHAKKPKLAKHLLENSFDNSAPMSGSVASPVASQMSNMSSQTKIIKFIGSRDRGKKGKGLKVSTGQHGSGGPWTIVEDQALVVLVHDMGPNWELVSDAINNILQFKCIFRKPQECKERHKFLMDRPSGDGADSAEDSGSSQPYPSTLPGIPKGSARQLFRSLHAHVEEDNIKSRFEKIIHIEQQSHFRKKKNDIQDLKQRAPIHSSHVLSLSQVIPNNLNGGVLTPLDLCDMATSNQDPLSTMYQQPNGLQLSSQSSIPSIHSPGGPNPLQQGLQGSPSMGIGNNLTPPPSQYTGSRDARYSIPRSGSLPIEEQQRLTQHNSMLPGRNAQASTLSSSGSLSGSERGMRMHPGGNGVGIMPGMNRSIPMARPGVQGIPSSCMLNSGSVLASNMGGMRGSMSPHSGIASGHGNTMFRPRDSLHGVRSGQSSEHQRQVVSPEMQIQTTQTNSAGVLPFGGLSSGFSTQIDSPPLPPYPGHPHVLGTPHPHLSTSNHSATPEQQAYLRMARERQIQQRLLQRQHQLQHPASSMTHQQPSVPLPSLSSAPPATHVSPVPHQQQKNLQGHGRSSQSGPGGVLNQGAKQRQRPAQQQYQQSGRQHPQQRQQSQSQQAKLAKGIGNISIDPSHINGLSANTASQVAENIHSPSSNHTQPQKPYVNVAPATAKPVQISSHLDGGNQGQGLCSNQGSSSTYSLNHQQFQGQSAAKAVNQPQPALQRSTQQSLAHSDFLTKSQVDHSQSYQKSCDVGPPSAVAASSPSSNVVRKVQDPISESAMTGASSSSVLSSSKDVTYSLGNSLQHESRKQQQETQAPPLEPVLQQKQSQHQLQQLEQPLQRVPQSQSQPQIQDGQNVAFTRTSNSRLD